MNVNPWSLSRLEICTMCSILTNSRVHNGNALHVYSPQYDQVITISFVLLTWIVSVIF